MIHKIDRSNSKQKTYAKRESSNPIFNYFIHKEIYSIYSTGIVLARFDTLLINTTEITKSTRRSNLLRYLIGIYNAAVWGIFCVVEFWGKVAQLPQNGAKQKMSL